MTHIKSDTDILIRIYCISERLKIKLKVPLFKTSVKFCHPMQDHKLFEIKFVNLH